MPSNFYLDSPIKSNPLTKGPRSGRWGSLLRAYLLQPRQRPSAGTGRSASRRARKACCARRGEKGGGSCVRRVIAALTGSQGSQETAGGQESEESPDAKDSQGSQRSQGCKDGQGAKESPGCQASLGSEGSQGSQGKKGSRGSLVFCWNHRNGRKDVLLGRFGLLWALKARRGRDIRPWAFVQSSWILSGSANCGSIF